MSGLLRRLTRRRAATADETGPATPGPSEPAGAPPDALAETSGGQPLAASGEQPTHVLSPAGEQPAGTEVVPGGGEGLAGDEPPSREVAVRDQPASGEIVPGDQPEPGEIVPGDQPSRGELVPAQPETGSAPAERGPAQLEPADAAAATAPATTRPAARDLPAGVDPAELESGPIAGARRGKLRRRLRYLRQVRELLLRDLGGFVYELHRTAGGALQESHQRLVTAKADRLGALDAEVRGLESRLGQPHAEPLLREPGIGGTCPVCGELHASDARYCSHCGEPLDEKARARREAQLAATVEPAAPEHPASEPGPSSVLWAAGPRPAADAEAAEAARLSPSTSEWLTGHGADEPSAAEPDEPATAQEAAATGSGEASGTGSDATPGETAATGSDDPVTPGEPSPAERPGAPDDAGADEPGDAAGEPRAESEPMAPDEAAERDDPAATGEQPERSEERSGFAPNGRRGDEVTPPVRGSDPLGSRGKPRP